MPSKKERRAQSKLSTSFPMKYMEKMILEKVESVGSFNNYDPKDVEHAWHTDEKGKLVFTVWLRSGAKRCR